MRAAPLPQQALVRRCADAPWRARRPRSRRSWSPSACKSSSVSFSGQRSAWLVRHAHPPQDRRSARIAADITPLTRIAAASSGTGAASGMEAVNKAVAKAADAAAATCAGREIAGKATKAGMVKYTIYDIAKSPCVELVLRYSQRRKLVRWHLRLRLVHRPCAFDAVAATLRHTCADVACCRRRTWGCLSRRRRQVKARWCLARVSLRAAPAALAAQMTASRRSLARRRASRPALRGRPST